MVSNPPRFMTVTTCKIRTGFNCNPPRIPHSHPIDCSQHHVNGERKFYFCAYKKSLPYERTIVCIKLFKRLLDSAAVQQRIQRLELLPEGGSLCLAHNIKSQTEHIHANS